MRTVPARSAEAWNRYWFTAVRPTDLAVGRALFFGGVLALYWNVDFSIWGEVADVFWQPIWVFDALKLGLPASGHVRLLQIVWKVTLALSAVGLLTRVSTGAAFGAGFYLLALPNNFGKIHHFDAILVVIMGILALSRCGDAWSLDALRQRRRDPPTLSPEYCWPVKAVWLALSMVYFTAGLAKLWTSGLNWIFSDNMRLLLLTGAYHTANADPWPGWGAFVASVPGLAPLFAGCTVAVEVLYPLAMVSSRLRLLLVPAAVLMHLGIRVLMGPTFEQCVLASVFWIPWGRLLQGLAAGKTGRPATEVAP